MKRDGESGSLGYRYWCWVGVAEDQERAIVLVVSVPQVKNVVVA